MLKTVQLTDNIHILDAICCEIYNCTEQLPRMSRIICAHRLSDCLIEEASNSSIYQIVQYHHENSRVYPMLASGGNDHFCGDFYLSRTPIRIPTTRMPIELIYLYLQIIALQFVGARIPCSDEYHVCVNTTAPRNIGADG